MEGQSSLLFLWQYGVSMFFHCLLPGPRFLRLLLCLFIPTIHAHTQTHIPCINSTVKSLVTYALFTHSLLLWEFSCWFNLLIPKASTFLYCGIYFSCPKQAVIENKLKYTRIQIKCLVFSLVKVTLRKCFVCLRLPLYIFLTLHFMHLEMQNLFPIWLSNNV